MTSKPPPTYILDANLLLRLADQNAPMRPLAEQAILSLLADGALLRTLPQSLFEFWAVATRPAANNGLGLSTSEAETLLDYFMQTFPTWPDDPATVTYWRHLIVQYGVSGKPTHDSRYIAAMQAHGLTHILTFNERDFTRYAPEGITATNPTSVPTAPAP